MTFSEQLKDFIGIVLFCIVLAIALKFASFYIKREQQKRLIKITAQAAKRKK